MPDLRPTSSAEGRESQLEVLVGGALVLFFGVPAIATVVAIGVPAAAITGVGLVLLAWFLPTTRDARVIRVLITMLGCVALGAAVVGLLG